MTEMVLIRGIPGSGKSTLANSKYPNHIKCEADQYFYNDGEYEFDRTQIGNAHRWCQQKARDALMSGRDVVVSNTFIKKWEMKPYIDMANELGVELKIEVATGHYGSIHGVPPEVIQRMKKTFEPM